MRKINAILQEVTKILLLFFLFFVWLRYFLSLFLAVLISAVLATLVWFCIWFFERKRKNHTLLKLKEKEDAEEMFLSLCCDGNSVDFFQKLAQKKHENVTKRKTHIVVCHPTGTKTVLFANENLLPLDAARFLEIYHVVKKEKAGKIVVCTFEVDKNIFPFLARFSEEILLLDRFETYERLFKLYDCFPQITHKKSTQKGTFKSFLQVAFNKKRAKNYFFSALALVFCSLFVKISLYYCIFASLLIVFALFSFFNPIFNTKQSTQVL